MSIYLPRKTWKEWGCVLGFGFLGVELPHMNTERGSVGTLVLTFGGRMRWCDYTTDAITIRMNQ